MYTNEKLAYRVAEAARLLSLSRSTVYELIAIGDIPSVRLGRSRGRGVIRVPAEALHKMIEQRTTAVQCEEAAGRLTTAQTAK
jgi:excisionase family DNA binding protein